MKVKMADIRAHRRALVQRPIGFVVVRADFQVGCDDRSDYAMEDAEKLVTNALDSIGWEFFYSELLWDHRVEDPPEGTGQKPDGYRARVWIEDVGIRR